MIRGDQSGKGKAGIPERPDGVDFKLENRMLGEAEESRRFVHQQIHADFRGVFVLKKRDQPDNQGRTCFREQADQVNFKSQIPRSSDVQGSASSPRPARFKTFNSRVPKWKLGVREVRKHQTEPDSSPGLGLEVLPAGSGSGLENLKPKPVSGNPPPPKSRSRVTEGIFEYAKRVTKSPRDHQKTLFLAGVWHRALTFDVIWWICAVAATES
ncbi:hypothetical protein FB451DRAFT_1187829 [Mycena latifolia]|nr:hypothetical protein FB451DRAFT_1187829 [Mycena latifolia]